MSLCDVSAITIQQTPQQQHQSTQSIADYLAQLLKDRKQMAAFPNVFNHVERLLDEVKCCE
ncbi:protein held out wings-like isoform X2 [Anastrepha ludens]|uniref:protein held out wings-like isoform X2 n=1 Tax=Anastrepha ludens TaxID=28586 RepID=UPI0023AEE3D2|nr:protein held out wings-like isoform X2 [Anastrepha ludens]